MKTNELNLVNSTHRFSTAEAKKGGHYKDALYFGRFFPTTSAQAETFLRVSINFNVLNSVDVAKIDALMSRNGYVANFKYTKSKTWVRLTNFDDFKNSLRKEFLL